GEMVEASAVGVVIDAARVPLLDGALSHAEQGHFSGGMKRNGRHVDAVFGTRLVVDASVPAPLAALLTEAETSGGRLFSVAPGEADRVTEAFGKRGEP